MCIEILLGEKKRERGAGGLTCYLVLDEKHSRMVSIRHFTIKPQNTFSPLCVKGKTNAKAFSFVALNCASSSDGWVDGAGGVKGAAIME